MTTAVDRPRFRLTLAQSLRLVAFCAVACACIAPMLRVVEASGGGAVQWLLLVLFEAVVIPLVWAASACSSRP